MQLKILMLSLIIGISFKVPTSNQKSGFSKDIDRYVEFISASRKSPVDYILKKFSQSDIVLLCERHHDEFTQYELILQLISDKRFIKQVGHIFTEIGSSANNHKFAQILSEKYLNELEIEETVLKFYRDLSYYPLWEKYPFFYFLQNIARLNNTLEDENKFRLYFTDLAFSWTDMTPEKYSAFRKSLAGRDKYMAQQIIQIYNKIKSSPGQRKKALIIMNYRHAFNDYSYDDGRNRDNVGRYLFEKYKGSISNIMLNSLAIKEGDTAGSISFELIQNGKWDAAFAAAGNPDIGFDFVNTPFGEDTFDYYPFRSSGVKYKDVFTGFIFYRSIQSHRKIWGIPNIINEEFGKTLAKRYKIIGAPLDDSYIEQFVSQHGDLRESKYENIDSLLVQRNQWLDSSLD